MQVETFVFNHFSQNTYIIIDSDTKLCAIVDPGCFFEREKSQLSKYISDNKLTVEYILFTHCHLDHAFGAKYVSETYPNAQICGHKDEMFFINDALQQSLRFGINMEQPPALTKFIEDGETINLGSSIIKAIHVPGHSKGSLCYYEASSGTLLCGDVLFSGSIGRSDLPGGNQAELISGITTKLLPLPDNTIIYSGHGPTTTILAEKETNPYL